MTIITLAEIKSYRPCPSTYDRFAKDFPNGLEVTEAELLRVAELRYDIDWLAGALLPSLIYAEFRRQKDPIDAEYRRQREPIYAELRRQYELIDAKLRRQKGPIFAEYRRQREPIDAKLRRQYELIDAKLRRQKGPIFAEYRRQIALVLLRCLLERETKEVGK